MLYVAGISSRLSPGWNTHTHTQPNAGSNYDVNASRASPVFARMPQSRMDISHCNLCRAKRIALLRSHITRCRALRSAEWHVQMNGPLPRLASNRSACHRLCRIGWVQLRDIQHVRALATSLSILWWPCRCTAPSNAPVRGNTMTGRSCSETHTLPSAAARSCIRAVIG